MTAEATLTPALEVKNLETRLSTSEGILRAVDGVDFTLATGGALGLVGESGSGKSMLARSLMNLLPRNAVKATGEVHLKGRDLRQLSSRQLRHVWGKEMAMVFQDPMTTLNPVMRIGRQMTESMREHTDLDRTARRRRALELLERVGIPDPERRMTAYPHELSGGMRQRVGIATALACKPSVVIADEPTTALDVTIQRQILDLLTELQRDRGMSLLLITHDLAVVAGRTDVVAVMYAGKIVEMAPTATLFRAGGHPYTRGLLKSMPRLDLPSHSRLTGIPGRPPRVIDPGPGCRFAPRCPRAQSRCLAETPQLRAGAESAHRIACFYPVGPAEEVEATTTDRPAVGAAPSRPTQTSPEAS